MGTAQTVVLAGTPKHLELERPLGLAKRDFLLINISGSCNYSCKKCCNMVPNKRVMISLEEITGMVLNAKNALGIRTVVFIGEGETTLAPNFKSIVSFVHKAGLNTVIFSTGYFIDEPLARFLAENNVSIVFSLDSLNENRYHGLTGTTNSFARVMQNIRACRNIFAEKIRAVNGKRVVFLAINMLLTKDSLDEVEAMKEFCGNDVLPVFNYPLMVGNALANKQLFGEVPKKIMQLAAPTNWSEKKEECGYFFNGITIGLEGSILACPYNLELTGKLMNIKGMRLEDAVEVHNKIIREFRKLDAKGYCVMRSPKYSQLLKKLSD